MVKLSVLKESYSYQVNHIGGGDVSWAYIFLLVVISLAWTSVKNSKFGDEAASPGLSDQKSFKSKVSYTSSAFGFQDLGVMLAFASIGCLLYQLNLVADTLGRLGAYFTVLSIPATSLMTSFGRRTTNGTMIMLVGCAAFFTVMNLYMGKSGVWPYTSTILGIG